MKNSFLTSTSKMASVSESRKICCMAWHSHHLAKHMMKWACSLFYVFTHTFQSTHWTPFQFKGRVTGRIIELSSLKVKKPVFEPTGQYLLSKCFSRKTISAVSEQVEGNVITQQPTMHSTVHRAFECRGSLALQLVEAIAAIKEGLSQTSSLSLMKHHYKRGQGSSVI